MNLPDESSENNKELKGQENQEGVNEETSGNTEESPEEKTKADTPVDGEETTEEGDSASEPVAESEESTQDDSPKEETSEEEPEEEKTPAEEESKDEPVAKETSTEETPAEEAPEEESIAKEKAKEEATSETAPDEPKADEAAAKEEEPKEDAAPAAKKADKAPAKGEKAEEEKDDKKEEPAPVVDEEMSEPQQKFDISTKDGRVQISTLDVDLPDFGAGDTISVHYKIKEGNKERIQQFKGVVLQRRGNGTTETITVRKVTGGIGIERIFPLHSPLIAKIEVNKRGKVRRARIFYLRKLKGKGARLKEKRS